jgi:hypothetical protein
MVVVRTRELRNHHGVFSTIITMATFADDTFETSRKIYSILDDKGRDLERSVLASWATLVRRKPCAIREKLVRVTRGTLPNVIIHRIKQFFKSLAGVKVNIVGKFIEAYHKHLAVCAAPTVIA